MVDIQNVNPLARFSCTFCSIEAFQFSLRIEYLYIL